MVAFNASSLALISLSPIWLWAFDFFSLWGFPQVMFKSPCVIASRDPPSASRRCLQTPTWAVLLSIKTADKIRSGCYALV
jgi:hypothetical protein